METITHGNNAHGNSCVETIAHEIVAWK